MGTDHARDVGRWASIGTTLRTRRRDAARAFGVAMRRPSLARAELAFGATCGAEWAFTVGLGIVAFQDGGPGRVGLVAVVRLIPSALLAPVATAMADRWPRERMLMASSALLAASSSTMALLLALDGPLALAYLMAAVATIALTPYRAAHSALLPSLCGTTDELAASNIVRGMVESIAFVVGPLMAAALIELGDLWVVFAMTAAMATAAGALLARLPYERPPSLAPATERRLRAEVIEGVRAAVGNTDAFCLILLAAVQTFLRGSLNVFTVVLALEVLNTGEAGVGVLQAALGVGAVLGALAAASLVGSRRMAAWFGGGVAMWGIPICVIGLVPSRPSALAMLAVIGVANAVLDVGLFTMLGRLAPDEVLARVYGVFESVVAIAVALGSVAAAVAIDALGHRGAMILLGAVAPVVIVLAAPKLISIDQSLAVRQGELDVLQRVPMLRTLPVPTIEHLARRIVPQTLRAGQAVIREGTIGQRYYVIAEGQVEVRRGGSLLRTMGPGEGFGEISLLRAVRRTTTVRATKSGPVELLGLDRQDFVSAVGGYSAASSAATETMDRWRG